jgi:NDP-sugar pyrophosphorylase family protein
MSYDKTVAAIVLAGGKGTRFSEIVGADQQKVLYPVNGVPLIKYTTDLLDQSTISRIVFNVKHRSRDVRRWVRDQRFSHQEISFSVQKRWTFVDAVTRAFAKTDEDIILICNGDEIRDGLILIEAIRFHLDQGSLATLIGARKRCLSRYRLLHINENHLLTHSEYCPSRFIDDQETEGIVNAGIAILNREAFANFDQADPSGGWDAMLKPLTITRQLSVYTDKNMHYFNVGTPEELYDAEEFFAGKR